MHERLVQVEYERLLSHISLCKWWNERLADVRRWRNIQRPQQTALRRLPITKPRAARGGLGIITPEAATQATQETPPRRRLNMLHFLHVFRWRMQVLRHRALGPGYGHR